MADYQGRCTTRGKTLGMRAILLPAHIVAGMISIVAGFTALYALKGAELHKRAGVIFVYAMLVMASCGLAMAIMKSQPANIAGGSIAIYLVSTGVLTLRTRDDKSRWLDAGGMLAAFTICGVCIKMGITALNNPKGAINGVPYQMLFVFAGVTLLAALGDTRTLFADGLRGAHRIARHLWRMCFAMFVATGSFFLGQAKIFPKPIRIIPLLAIPVLLVLATMFYWMVRVSFTKWDRRRAIDSVKPLSLARTA
jgi:uncharacterized membrane protein